MVQKANAKRTKRAKHDKCAKRAKRAKEPAEGIQMQENRLSTEGIQVRRVFSFSDHEEWLQRMASDCSLEGQDSQETGCDGLPHMHVDANDDGEEDDMTDITSSGLGSGLGSVPESSVMPC